jgi:hypothetical protein
MRREHSLGVEAVPLLGKQLQANVHDRGVV